MLNDDRFWENYEIHAPQLSPLHPLKTDILAKLLVRVRGGGNRKERGNRGGIDCKEPVMFQNLKRFSAF